MSDYKIDVLVFGSAIVDFVCYVNRLPMAGETLHGYKFANGFGGKGANQCVAAGRLGAKTALIAKLGTDTWGKRYIEHLQNENVDINFVKQCENESTGIAQIAVSKSGDNHIIVVAGANNKLNAKDVLDAKNFFENSKVMLCQLETPLEGNLAALKKFEGISILNAAPALKDTPADILRAATILCVNETEAALMCRIPDIKSLDQAKTAIYTLLEMGAQTVVITLGHLGAVYSSNKDQRKCIHVAANNVGNVLDTTGAGDAFLGAFAFHLAKYPDKELHQHIGYANCVASYSVQFPGTQSSFPKADEILPYLSETYTYYEL